MTSLATALVEAGYRAGKGRLRLLAYEMLKKHGDVRRATGEFTTRIRPDLELMGELFDYGATRNAAIEELEQAAKDMRGERTEEAGGAQLCFESQYSNGAPVSSTEKADGEEARPAAGSLKKHLPSPSADEIGGAEGARVAHEGLSVFSDSAPPSPTDEREGAQTRHDGLVAGRPPLSSAPKRGPEALARIHAILPKSKFDTIILRDGKTPIGDLVWSAIPRFIANNKYETALLKLISDLPPPPYPNTPIRDLQWAPGEFERLVQKAAELSE